MRSPKLSTLFLTLLVAGITAGCNRSWRPSLEAVRTSELPPVFPMGDYLAHASGTEWLYERSISPPLSDPVPLYRRRIVGSDVSEGCLVGHTLSRLSSRPAEGDPNLLVAPDEIESLVGDKQGFIVTFEPALALYPPTLAPGEVFESEADLHYFDRTGRHRSDGTVVRRVACEGVESVRTPAGAFENCLRLRIEMTLHIHWGPTIETTEYCWLAPGLGTVRRIERIAGVAWFLLVDSTAEYALVEPRPAPSVPPPSGAVWLSCATVLFDRGLPQPVVAGMFQELTLGPADRPAAEAP